jgi:hypothetical protein
MSHTHGPPHRLAPNAGSLERKKPSLVPFTAFVIILYIVAILAILFTVVK